MAGQRDAICIFFTFSTFFLVSLLQVYSGSCALIDTPLDVSPREASVVVGRNTTVNFFYKEELHNELAIDLSVSSPSEVSIAPASIRLTPLNRYTLVALSGHAVTSRAFVDVKACTVIVNGTLISNCSFDTISVFVEVKVVKSDVLSVLVTITGWIYFIAWSISFYPQILLNYERKSVVGLNFDFLALNTIGFTCYTIYNAMFYFDKEIQEIYVENNIHALIPVLLNDVVFSTHALLACIVTGLQCFIYERANQHISYVCRGWGSLLVAFSLVSFLVTLLRLINWLRFIYFLSYVKLAVTVSKYFPQAILNYRRQSTVGWSIGNILLDFTGGVMDIFQMVLQASNTDDWTAFYGNQVKFGLGFVSIFFDVFFMIQHYILYKHPPDELAYDQEGACEATSSTPISPSSVENVPPPPYDDTEQPQHSTKKYKPARISDENTER